MPSRFIKKTEDEVTMLMRLTTCFNVTVRLCSASLWLILLFQSSPAVAAARTGDKFLTGYITAILERDLQWERDSYRLKVSRGVATLTLFKDDPVRREAADKQLRNIDGLNRMRIVVKPADPGKPGAVSRFLGITGEGEVFPMGYLFRPFLADPKQPQFFVSVNRFISSGVQYNMASVSLGETFGMYRFFGNREGNGLQLSADGALFAQFNMDTPSYNLINADYIIGIPATYRHGDNSLRFRIYHQSSHLGDEFLLSPNHPERVNLSYEAIEFIYSRDLRECRVYGGGEYLIRKDPVDLKPMSAHWGLEYRGSKPLVLNGRPLVGVDMKSFEEHNWTIDTNVKIGLEFGQPNPEHRRLRLLADWYKGFDPYGQFYNTKVESYGLGMSLGF